MRTATVFRSFAQGLLALLLAFGGLAHRAAAQSFLHATGPKILNASNQEVLLNGMNLGGWAVQEGYIIKPNWAGINGKQTQGTVKKTLYNAGMSDAAVETFYQNYRNNFITKADIDYIARQGFNCVRLPLHYDLFLTPSQRAVRNAVLRGTTPYTSYVSSLTSWYNGNQLFVDPNNMEAYRMIDNVLSWCAANNIYVVLDLHAAPGAQGNDFNIADAIQGYDLWTRPVYQDITVRLWETIARRYKSDARVAMYDLINEPNQKDGAPVPTNPQLHDLLQRLISAVRAQGDNHLLLLEGNGFGNDYNYMEKRTFTNTANLVYNSHRYSGTGYELDNGVNSTGGGPNSLRFIGTMKQFRIDNDVPIWVGETGENSDAWMRDAAKALNSVGIGWCHWTYKRFDSQNIAAFVRVNPPYIVDGLSGLNQVLTNIQFANCVPNSTVGAVSPNQNGIVNYPGGGNYNGTTGGGSTGYAGPPLGRIYEISSKNGGKALEVSASSQANGARVQQWNWVSAANQKFKLVDAGAGYVRLVNLNSNKSLDVAGLSTADGALINQYDWLSQDSQYWQILSNGDGTYRILNKFSGKALDVQDNSTADGAAVQQWAYGGGNNQRWYFSDQGAAQRGSQASGAPAPAAPGSYYPNPVLNALTYQLPVGGQAHTLSVVDLTGRQVLARTFGNTGEQNTVDLSALRTGLYLVRLSGATFSSELKISKQ
ncbi:RICIN domain-containing protein [Hymenobacter nivis]|uniref:T9SS C-terminal target domain-containing protein n=1 Tax=Hymenobacter nivis TaxID=1850093 RepID=A0A502GW05_9BACT|nr:RICIN domain-containing protein [Hymenobacter nivis]TPG65410.1 T9SS C-terminal target domain-containing protein [Hymenobacter nivis]